MGNGRNITQQQAGEHRSAPMAVSSASVNSEGQKSARKTTSSKWSLQRKKTIGQTFCPCCFPSSPRRVDSKQVSVARKEEPKMKQAPAAKQAPASAPPNEIYQRTQEPHNKNTNSGILYSRSPNSRETSSRDSNSMVSYCRNPNSGDPNSMTSYCRNPNSGDPYGRDPNSRDPYYGRDPYSRGPYCTDPYSRDPYTTDSCCPCSNVGHDGGRYARGSSGSCGIQAGDCNNMAMQKQIHSRETVCPPVQALCCECKIALQKQIDAVETTCPKMQPQPLCCECKMAVQNQTDAGATEAPENAAGTQAETDMQVGTQAGMQAEMQAGMQALCCECKLEMQRQINAAQTACSGAQAGIPALCYDCKFAIQKQITGCSALCENREPPVPQTTSCSACCQALHPPPPTPPPPTTDCYCQADQTEFQVQQAECMSKSTSVARFEPPPPPPPAQGQCCRCQRPVCCVCQYPVDLPPQPPPPLCPPPPPPPPPTDICPCGRPSCPPNCQCGLKNKQGITQTVNMIKVYENNPYFTEMIKLKALNYAKNAHEPFSLLMRNNQRLMKLLTEKSSSISNCGDLPKPMDASFTPDTVVKTTSDYSQRKEHEHCKILTAVCEAILANCNNNSQFKEVPSNTQDFVPFSRSETVTKDASGQTEITAAGKLSEMQVQTEISINKMKDFSTVRRRKKELPDVHITTSNTAMILDRDIHANKSSIPIRRRRKNSEQSISYATVSHGKKQTLDWKRTSSSRFHSKCTDKCMDDIEVELRKERLKSTNSDANFMSSLDASDND